MPFKEGLLTERAQVSFKQLQSAAASLNSRSDLLGKAISRLDSSIQKLSIGVSAWVSFSGWSSEDNQQFANDQVGYAKVGSRWGIAIRSFSGFQHADDYSSYEEWLFSDAPRALRLKAVDKIPDLFERLSSEVVSLANNVDQQLKILDGFTGAIDALVAEQDKPIVVPTLKQRFYAALIAGGFQYTADAVENSLVEEFGGEVLITTPRAYALSMKGPEVGKTLALLLGRQPKIKFTVGDPSLPSVITAAQTKK